MGARQPAFAPPCPRVLLVDVLAGQDQHAAAARARVVHPLARPRVDQSHHHPHHWSRRVELAALLACRLSELADQVLLRDAEQIGKLEVLTAKAVAVEVADQVAQLPIGELDLADLLVESMWDVTPASSSLGRSKAPSALFRPVPTSPTSLLISSQRAWHGT